MVKEQLCGQRRHRSLMVTRRDIVNSSEAARWYQRFENMPSLTTWLFASERRQEAQLSAVAETARVTIRSVIAVGRLTLTVTINMTYVNLISIIELLIRGILYPVMSCQLRRKTIST